MPLEKVLSLHIWRQELNRQGVRSPDFTFPFGIFFTYAINIAVAVIIIDIIIMFLKSLIAIKDKRR